MSNLAEEIPGPRGFSLLGSLQEVRRDRLAFIVNSMHQYGDLVRYRMGFSTLVVINTPLHVKHVLHDNDANYIKGLGLSHAKRFLGEGLLTSRGAHWKRQRSVIQPAFERPSFAALERVVQQSMEKLANDWAPRARGAEVVDLAHEVRRVTLDIIVRSVLGGDPGGASSEHTLAAFTSVLEEAMESMQSLWAPPLWVPTPRNVKLARSLRLLDQQVRLAVSRRQEAGGTDPGSLLARLLGEGALQGSPGAAWRQLRDEIVTHLWAGHDTGASAVAWTFYLLSRHPEVEAELRDELVRELGGRPPAVADLPALKYTRMVLQESMRLYPPIWLIPRKALGPDVIADHPVPAGAEVLVAVYSIHRNPEFWSQPERFLPERFSGESRRQHPYDYLPFGAGPRKCVGAQFGMVEAQLMLAAMAQRFKLSLAEDARVVPEAMLALRPRGLLMRVTPAPAA